MFLRSFKNIDKQNMLVKQCLSWWPNRQACLTSKVRNVRQTMSVRLSRALDASLKKVMTMTKSAWKKKVKDNIKPRIKNNDLENRKLTQR